MRIFFIIGLLFLTITGLTQDSLARRKLLFREEESTDLWLGFNVQGNWAGKEKETLRYLEIGIGKGRYHYSRHAVSGVGVYLSEEILLNGNKRIFGTKLGCFVHALAAIGFSLVYYTDFEKGNLKLRPELGVGVGRFGIVGSYNIPAFRNSSLPELQGQNAQLTIRAGFGIKKKERKIGKLI
ncbi:MAG TPA: hypothetical protein VMR70_20010 [Flavisolibacter sp.]|nr:hypothetical protein [Flavisolibacter sp.]